MDKNIFSANIYLIPYMHLFDEISYKILSLTRPDQGFIDHSGGSRFMPHSPSARASTLSSPPRGQSLTSGLVRKCTIITSTSLKRIKKLCKSIFYELCVEIIKE